MERRFRRKIWRFEKQISEVRTKKQEEWHDPMLAYLVRFHTAKVAAIVLEGEPKIDEPLIRAQQRAWQRFGLSTCVKEFDGDILYFDVTKGKDDAEAFPTIFDHAPLWLLDFTTVALDAFILKFQLPDTSAPSRWARDGIKDAERWPELPLGTMIAGEPVTEQIVVEPRRLSADDCKFIMHHHPEEGSAEWDRYNKIWTQLHKRKG
jgi:hypothetical protein